MVGRYSEQRQIERIIAVGDVVIKKGAEINSTSGRADFLASTQVVTLTESPELDKGGSILAADKIFIFLKENRSQADGNVRMRLKGTDMGSALSTGGTSKSAGSGTTAVSPNGKKQ